MKQQAQQTIRWLHGKLARKGLPRRLAIYFHELELSQWPAFRSAIKALKNEGYRSVSANQFLAGPSAAATNGQDAQAHSALSDRLLFISFDDNYRSWHEALPLLDELGVRATFYTNSGPLRDCCSAADLAAYFDRIDFVGERICLSRQELRQISDAGHDIGCHTHWHYALCDLPRGRWAEEILGCKQRLEDITGRSVAHFSYPYGMRRFMPQGIPDYCQSLGFKSVAHGIPGMQHQNGRSGAIIHRTGWRLGQSSQHNLLNLEIDGRLFERITGRSAIG